MGDYYKLQYVLRDINDFIDQEKQKLSDKYHELELSHNRKTKALKKIQTLMENYCFAKQDISLQKEIVKQCKNALFSNGRVKLGVNK